MIEHSTDCEHSYQSKHHSDYQMPRLVRIHCMFKCVLFIMCTCILHFGIILYTYRKQHGRLKVCSHSILFDPLDIRHPVIKVCYKHCGVIKEYHDTTGSLRLINHLVCSYAMHIAMKLLRLKLPSFLRFSCHVCTYTLQIDVVYLLYCMVATYLFMKVFL